ncbi:hypothetical protein B0H11DRAFT_1973242 [Mycena galericulata]|nr:hypothetical protein B0H11DRAFT_1973242 [Mycena galericulata]
MDTLPSELIREIVKDIDDPASLKECSLVSTGFREPCQGFLFRSLSLWSPGLGLPDKPSYTATWTFLQESPHLLPHFRRLMCWLPPADAEPGDVQSLCAILAHLSNVRDCVFCGHREYTDDWDDIHIVPFPWHDIPSQLSHAVVQLIQRRRLSRLSLEFLGVLPSNILTLFFGAARTLTLSMTSIDINAGTAGLPSPPSVVQNLIIYSSSDIANVLASRAFCPQAATVRKLWVEGHIQNLDTLISTVAHNLEHLRHRCFTSSEIGPGFAIVFPTRLPSLRSVELILYFRERDEPGFVSYLSSILGAAPETLEEVCIHYHNLMADVLVPLAPQTIAALGNAIAGSACSARIRWHLLTHDGHETSWTKFVTSLREGLPKLHMQGRLVFERVSRGEGYFTSSWVNRT